MICPITTELPILGQEDAQQENWEAMNVERMQMLREQLEAIQAQMDEIRARRRAKKAESRKRHRQMRLALFARDGFVCQYCFRNYADDPDMLNLDHVKPQSRGGRNEPANLTTTCMACNSLKADAPVETIEEARRFVQEKRARQREQFLKELEDLHLAVPR